MISVVNADVSQRDYNFGGSSGATRRSDKAAQTKTLVVPIQVPPGGLGALFSRQTRTWSINPSIMQMSHKFSVQVNKVNKFGHKSSTIITCTTVMIMTFGATENKRYRKEPITNPQHRRQPVINRHFTDSSGSKVSKFVEAKVISFPFSLPKQNKKKLWNAPAPKGQLNVSWSGSRTQWPTSNCFEAARYTTKIWIIVRPLYRVQ